jgi:hypothetical protein
MSGAKFEDEKESSESSNFQIHNVMRHKKVNFEAEVHTVEDPMGLLQPAVRFVNSSLAKAPLVTI